MLRLRACLFQITLSEFTALEDNLCLQPEQSSLPPFRIPHRYIGQFFVEFIFYYIITSLFHSGSNGSRNDYETLTNLCIALLILLIAWLTVLLIIFLYCRRYLLRSRPNRLVKVTKRVK